MTETDKLRAELEHYKAVFGVGDVATRAYIQMVKMLEAQVEIMKDFTLKDQIAADKTNLMYDRVNKIFENMSDNVIKLKDLKDKLGIQYIEKTEKVALSNPQTIGKRLTE